MDRPRDTGACTEFPGTGADPDPAGRPDTVDLIDDSWFFGNLFDQRPPRTMFRCFSDPCTSSSFSRKVLPNGSAESPSGGGSVHGHVGDEGRKMEDGKSRKGKSRLTRQLSEFVRSASDQRVRSCKAGNGQCPRRNLVRAPSLPVTMGREDGEDDDDESDVRMSSLILQAFAQSSKGSSGPPRSTRSPRNTELESSQSTGTKETGNTRRVVHQKALMKSFSNLESEHFQGSHGWGFELDKVGLKGDAVNKKVSSCLQEKKRAEDLRRPQLSDAWPAQSYGVHPPPPPPPSQAVPSWVRTNSAEDLKAHIKFWARSVATNVRQEC